jgi:hypothetical protein
MHLFVTSRLWRRRAVVLSGLASVLAGTAARAGGTTAPLTVAPLTDEGVFRSPLDGKVFIVDYGPMGHASLGLDVLTFAAGTFASQGCERLGFAAAPYWLRGEPDGVHFRAEMTSSEHGTLAFTGLVRGAEIEVASLWTRQRWYRTVRLESWYRGRLADPDQPLPTKP